MSRVRIDFDGVIPDVVSVDGVDIRDKINALQISMGVDLRPEMVVRYVCHEIELDGEIQVVHVCPQDNTTEEE